MVRTALRPEIGLRLALGATAARVTYETAIDSVRVAVSGIIAGAFVVVLGGVLAAREKGGEPESVRGVAKRLT